jgi:hypothetical protein
VNFSGFTDTALEVEVMVGAYLPPMRLIANIYRPQTADIFYGQYRLDVGGARPFIARRLVRQTSAPLGLLGPPSQEMQDKCRKHIEKMIETPMYAAQVTAGDSSCITHRILEATQQYYFAKDVSLQGVLDGCGFN